MATLSDVTFLMLRKKKKKLPVNEQSNQLTFLDPRPRL